MVISALIEPRKTGWKTTLTWQLAPAARDVPQLSVSVKSDCAGSPRRASGVIEILIANELAEELVILTACDGLA